MIGGALACCHTAGHLAEHYSRHMIFQAHWCLMPDTHLSMIRATVGRWKAHMSQAARHALPQMLCQAAMCDLPESSTLSCHTNGDMQVTMASLSSGIVIITVTAYNLPIKPQPYALVVQV